LHEVLKMDPDYPDGLRNLGAVFVQQGRHEEAVAAYRKAQSSAPMNWGSGLLAHALAVAGHRDASERALQALIANEEAGSNAALAIATAYVGLGEHEHALGWLERARVERDARLMFIQADPLFDTLRAEARFQKVAGTIGLRRPAETQ
jgi:tetratricopeptide (TPR) repeat protein